MAVTLERATVRVPATVANLGAGFDVLGAAVGLHAEITLEPADGPQVSVAGADVPQDDSNLIYRSAVVAAQMLGYRGAFALRATSPIPQRSGLGSSAAAIVGGVVAATRLLGGSPEPDRLLALAAEIEGHPDNVAAALFGGVVVVARDEGGFRWVKVTPALPLAVALAVPALEVETDRARRLLPAQVAREDAVFNLGQVALLVAALGQGRGDLLRGALGDRLHQPYRAALVPGFERVVAAAVEAGAYGAVLSGSGPTVAALAAPEVAAAAGEAMQDAFRRAGVGSRVIVTAVETRGALDEPRGA
ncbi:MAG: homoserine kinase [Armatimonadota bacterium]|nr:homoserine kinase [Armatimonadota bacterium]